MCLAEDELANSFILEDLPSSADKVIKAVKKQEMETALIAPYHWHWWVIVCCAVMLTCCA